MIRMLFTFEDHTLSAHRNSNINSLEGLPKDWEVVICEHQTGAEKTFKWDDKLFAAVIDLAVGGDTHDAKVRDYLYAITYAIEWEEGGIDFRIIP